MKKENDIIVPFNISAIKILMIIYRIICLACRFNNANMPINNSRHLLNSFYFRTFWNAFKVHLIIYISSFFLNLDLSQYVNMCILECFIHYLTFYSAVHISSYTKSNNSMAFC